MRSFSLAFRNLSRQKKRSFLLSGAVAFGFFVVIIIDSISSGALANMADQFSYILGGHIQIQGVYKNSDGTKQDIINDSSFLEEVLETANIDYKYICRRSAATGILSFEGVQVQMNIFGVDLKKEVFLPDTMTLISGSFEDMAKFKNGIILGESIAKELKLEVGDIAIFQNKTSTGQATFAELQIVGISKDMSLLSSIVTYANIDFLNELLEINREDFYMYNLILKNQKVQNDVAQQIEETIRLLGGNVTSREQAYRDSPNAIGSALNKQVKNADWEGTMYIVYSMNDYIPSLQQILSVVQSVSFGILAVLFLVVMIGISNTFRMVVFERIREIGTMRALGMHRNSVSRIFIAEAVLLTTIGAFAGFVFSVIAMSLFSLFYISSPELSMFLNNGHISYILAPRSIFLKFLLVFVLAIIAMISSARTASKLNPAEALRTTK